MSQTLSGLHELKTDTERQVRSLYVHIPFCARFCSYCAFSKTAKLSFIDAYLDALEQEIQERIVPLKKAAKPDGVHTKSPETADSFFETIYIGGGTPSVLSNAQTERLLCMLAPFASEGTEWTIEVNPESVTASKAALYAKYGINRVSIGLQTFNENRLRALGRFHGVEQAKEAIDILRTAGLNNLCADLMYDFPKESLEELQADLDAFLALDIDHLSIYSLILEEGTRLAKTVHPEDLDEDLNAAMYEAIEKRLGACGYEHYEISSFARSHRYGRHNVLIWEDGLYAGVGFGACGREYKGLYDHEKTLEAYLQNPCRLIYEEDPDPAFDALMTGLRTVFGVDLAVWQERYQINFIDRFGSVIEKWNGKLLIRDGRLCVSKEGMEVLDSILVDFLCEK